MKNKVGCLLFVALSLSACSQVPPRAVIETGPSVNISPNDAMLEEPIAVYLSAKFYGSDKEQNLGKRILTVCISTLNAEMLGGTCNEGRQIPLSESIQIVDGTLEKDMGEVVVPANEVVELEHYLAFTSTETRIVRIKAFIGRVGDDGQTVYTTEDQSDVVNFYAVGVEPSDP